jgi:hypothetical protein
MLRKSFFFLLFVSFAMVSCDPTPMAESNFEFDESLQWKKSEPVVLKLDIRENAEPCELFLDVRYTTLFPFDKLELHIEKNVKFLSLKGGKDDNDINLFN